MFPQKICTGCISQIKTACAIKEKCLDTDQLLRQKFKKEEISENTCENPDYFFDSGCNTRRNDLLVFLKTEITPEFKHEQFLEENSIESSHSGESLVSDYPVSVNPRGKKKLKRPSKKQKNLIAHNKNKKPEEHDYRCFICERVFDLISAKDFHVKQDHANIKVCRICKKKKPTAISLETHLRYHFFGFRFLCSSCGKSFRFKNLLENHLNVEHYNTVKFNCDLCQYYTKFKINLERHVKSVHMKLKNYKCYKCDDHEYSTQVGLNLHLYRVHAVQAPVTCEDCCQGFTFESELRVHKKHCTGSKVRLKKARPQDAEVDILENGFRCRVCLQIYESRSKWSVHYHHKHKNSNVCTICNKQMASSTSLFKHIQVREEKFLLIMLNSGSFRFSITTLKSSNAIFA